jgi:3-hydroxyacyl-CoA dehydrogenase/3-hydroxy-2-methylbutyryl-CoA dehydrogenase
VKLSESVAVVTGGASGLGAAFVRRVIAAGGRAVIADLPTSQGAELADELGSSAFFVPIDVTNDDAIDSAFQRIAELTGHVNTVINAAGIPGLRPMVVDRDDIFPMDLFRRVYAVNIFGTFNVIRHAVSSMLSAKAPPDGGERGVIVNVSSISGLEGMAGHAAYSSSKGAVVALALPLARDLAPFGIRVNTICPGTFHTGMTPQSEEKRRSLMSEHLFPARLGMPDEFAHLAAAVVENPMINAECLRIDAGARLGWRREQSDLAPGAARLRFPDAASPGGR